MPAKHVQPGDPLSIDANVYNAAVDFFQGRNGPRASGGRISLAAQSNRAIIQNNTGADLDQFNIVGLADPIVLPDPDLDSFFEAIGFKTVVVSSTELYRFAITQEAIPDGEYGEVVISGMSFAKVADPSGTVSGAVAYLVPNGTPDAMQPTDCGICRVLWNDTGVGPQWAIVNMG